MKANALVMESPGELQVREIDLPDPGPDDVLLRVELTGICGSDVHMNDGGLDVEFPVVPGHEFAGVIEEVGENVETDSAGAPITAGDALSVVPAMVCGECWYCENMPQRPPACTSRERFGFENVERYPYAGGMSEYVVLPAAASYYRLPDGMAVEYGALVEPLSVAMHAMERAYPPGLPQVREGFGVGRSVAIQGAGPVGLLTASAATAAGAGQVIVIDAIADRLDLAEEFGATDTVDLSACADDDALVDRVRGLTKGGVGPDVAVEAAGVPAAFRQAMELPHDGGTVVEVGHFAYNGETEVDPSRLVRGELDVVGSLAYPPSQFETATALLDQLRSEVPFRTLFNHGVALDDAASAFDAQASGDAFRATVHPHGT